MAPHLADDVCFALALAMPPEPTRVRLHEHLATCGRCRGAYAQARDDAAQLALALVPAAPPALLREGLQNSLREVSRFTPLMPELTRLLRLAPSAMESVLDRIETLSAWETGPRAGVRLMPIAATTALVRVAPGRPLDVPPPRRGEALILQGQCRDAAGAARGAGQTLRVDPTAGGMFTTLPGPDLICALALDSAP